MASTPNSSVTVQGAPSDWDNAQPLPTSNAAQPQTVLAGRGAPVQPFDTSIVPGALQGLGQMLYGAGKGALSGVLGAPGDANAMLRQYVQSNVSQDIQNALQSLPAPSTSAQIAQSMPTTGSQTEDAATWLGQNVLAPMVGPEAIAATKDLPIGLSTEAIGDLHPPKGDLNLNSKVTEKSLKGPDVQSVQNFTQQLKNLPGVTKDGANTATELLQRFDPATKMSKSDFVDALRPSQYSKVDLKGAASDNDQVLWHEAENQVKPHDVYAQLGIPAKYADDFEAYHYGNATFDELPKQLQSLMTKNGLHEERDISDRIYEAHMDAASEIYDTLLHDPEMAGARDHYAYADAQRLAGHNMSDSEGSNTAGYFEMGVTHPNGPKNYAHFSGAPQGTIGHVRGTFLDDFTNSYPGAEDDVLHLANPKPNSMLIEEIQSDANKVADQTGPLHQVHGTLFKAAVQHALENGADTVYLPTAKTIGQARRADPARYAPIYDQQVMKEGVNPLKEIPGVSVSPIDDTYHEISFTPEAKERILHGKGQTTPGYKKGGVIRMREGGDPSLYNVHPQFLSRNVEADPYEHSIAAQNMRAAMDAKPDNKDPEDYDKPPVRVPIGKGHIEGGFSTDPDTRGIDGVKLSYTRPFKAGGKTSKPTLDEMRYALTRNNK